MHILSGNQRASTDRQVEREFEFRHFLTLRTRLRISKFRVYLCKKHLVEEMSLSDCITL